MASRPRLQKRARLSQQGKPEPGRRREDSARHLAFSLGLVVECAMWLEKTNGQPLLASQGPELGGLLQDQVLDLGGRDAPLAPAKAFPIGIARVSADGDSPIPGDAERLADRRGVSRMAQQQMLADEIRSRRRGRCRSPRPGRRSGRWLDSWFLAAVQSRSSRLASNSRESIARNWIRSPARIGKWPWSGSAIRSGVRPSRCQPPGQARG